MNKKLLYETIMKNVSKEVKKALNEAYVGPADKATVLDDFENCLDGYFEAHDYWPMPMSMFDKIIEKCLADNVMIDNALKYFLNECPQYTMEDCKKVGIEAFKEKLGDMLNGSLVYCVNELENEYEEDYADEYEDVESMYKALHSRREIIDDINFASNHLKNEIWPD